MVDAETAIGLNQVVDDAFAQRTDAVDSFIDAESGHRVYIVDMGTPVGFGSGSAQAGPDVAFTHVRLVVDATDDRLIVTAFPVQWG